MIVFFLAANFAGGTVGLLLGVASCTFRNFYLKHAVFAYFKNDSIQEVVVVSEFVEGVEE